MVPDEVWKVVAEEGRASGRSAGAQAAAILEEWADDHA